MGKEICVCKKNGTRICERGFCKKGRSSIMYRETMEKLIFSYSDFLYRSESEFYQI